MNTILSPSLRIPTIKRTHTVSLINGIRIEDSKFTHFVIHDPGLAPFLPIPTKRCFESAKFYENKNVLNFVAVTHNSIQVNPDACFKEFLETLKKKKNVHQEDLLKTNADFDIKMALMNVNEICEKVFKSENLLFPLDAEDEKKEYLEKIEKCTEKITSRVWVTSLFSKDKGCTELVYLRSAEHPYTPCCYIAIGEMNTGIFEDWLEDQDKTSDIDNNNEPQPQKFEPIDSPIEESTQKFDFTPSVLTSSSPMSLNDLTEKLFERPAKPAVDIFLFRNEDIIDILKTKKQLCIDPDMVPDMAYLLEKKVVPRNNWGVTYDQIFDCLKYEPDSDDSQKYLKRLLERGYVSAIDILSYEDKDGRNPNIDVIKTWITENLHGLKISAFATFFPQITSERIDLRRRAIMALKNCMKLGIQLQQHTDSGKVIVEVVGGSFLDRVVQSGREDVIQVRNRENVCALAARSLATAFRDAEADKHEYCTLSMELEPGHCYLINDLDSVATFVEQADKVTEQYKIKKSAISLNLDIGHYLSVGIEPSKIRNDIWNRFSHSHISYLQYDSNQHYRDLPVVKNLFKNRWQTAMEYIKRYSEEASKNNRTCPISKAISIELEGGPYFSWIEESLESLFGMKLEKPSTKSK